MTREHYDSLLRSLDDRVIQLGDMVAGTIARCISALDDLDVTAAQEIIEGDAAIDRVRDEIEQQAVTLIATQQPMAGDLRNIVSALIIASELERIGDYAEGIAGLTLRMAAEPVSPPISDIRVMAEITQRLLLESLRSFKDRDIDRAGRVWTQDDEVDALYESVFRRCIMEMITDSSSVRTGTYRLWVAHNIERMADRVTNIAERTAFVVTGDVASFRDGMRSRMPPM